MYHIFFFEAMLLTETWFPFQAELRNFPAGRGPGDVAGSELGKATGADEGLLQSLYAVLGNVAELQTFLQGGRSKGCAFCKFCRIPTWLAWMQVLDRFEGDRLSVGLARYRESPDLPQKSSAFQLLI